MTILALCFFVTQMTATIPLAVGDVAPNFSATDTQDQAVHLKDFVKRGPVVLVFFPKARTSICTQELATFVAKSRAFTAKGARILAISADNKETLAGFRHELGASFAFVPDPQGELLKLYDTKMPMVTMAKRRTYLIDSFGRIAFIADGAQAASLEGLFEALLRL